MKNVARFGHKEAYETITIDPLTGVRHLSETRIWIRRFMSLAFVPPLEVEDAFNDLVNQIPSTLDIDDFLAYFKSTWVKGIRGEARYPPGVWNVRGRTLLLMNRTNNFVESFHNTFKQLLGHSHPTIWAFIDAVALQQGISDGKIVAVLTGDPAPARHARHKQKDARILNATRQHGTIPLLQYLDLIADI